jgi:hypothetical protein
VALIPGKNLLLCFNRQCHSRGNAPCLLLISLWYVHQNTTRTQRCGEAPEASEPLLYRKPGRSRR